MSDDGHKRGQSAVSGLFGEFMRRRVVQSALIYAAIAWSVTEVATFLLDAIPVFPSWSRTLLAVLFLTGFPVAMFLAWRFDVGPDGIRRTVARSRQGRVTILVAVFLLVASTTGLFYLIYPRVKHLPATAVEAPFDPPPNSIAALPLLNVGDDPANELFSKGLPDAIIHKLANVPEIIVVARTSSFAFERAGVDAVTIARELNARYLLEGSVQRSGDQVRIISGLLDTVANGHLWSIEYDAVAADVFELQNQIVLEVVKALELTLDKDQRARLLAHGTHDVSAYLAFLRGTAAVNSRSLISVDEAERHFRTALELDPGYARAWLGLARVDDHRAAHGELSRDSATERILRHAEQALELDPNLGNAYVMRAVAIDGGMFGERMDEVYELLERARRLSPNEVDVIRAQALWSCSWSDRDRRCQERKLELLSEVIRRDPEDPNSYLDLAWTLQALDRNDRALDVMREALRRDPRSLRARYGLMTLYWSGVHTDWVMAVSCVREAIGLDPDNVDPRGYLAVLYVDLGLTEAAAEMIEELVNLGARSDKFSVEHVRAELALRIGIVDHDVSAREQSIETLEAQWQRLVDAAAEQATVRSGRAAAVALDLAAAHRRHGDPERANELIRAARVFFERELETRTSIGAARLIKAYARSLLMTNEIDGALAQLERLPQTYLRHAWMVAADPTFAALRDEPRFRRVLADTEARIAGFRDRLASLGDNLPPCVPNRRGFNTLRSASLR